MLGNLLVLVSVIGSAGFVVWSRRTAQPAEEGEPAEESVGRTAWQFLGATLAGSPFALGSWWTGGSRIATAEPYQLVAAVAVLLCGLSALLAFNVGIGTVTASRAGLLFTLQPLAGAVTAVVPAATCSRRSSVGRRPARPAAAIRPERVRPSRPRLVLCGRYTWGGVMVAEHVPPS
jgi:hypothetical protein